MFNIALFGPPGAGKGTQSKHLISKYNLTYISTGDILREEIAAETSLGKKVKDIINHGELVPDELMSQIIEKKISSNLDSKGILFDGFPRTVAQADILDNLLQKFNTRLTCMLSLEVPYDLLKERMIERGKTSGRSDDNLEVIENRFVEYEKKTKPVIDFYQRKKIYHHVDGVGTIDEIFERLCNKIDALIQ